MWGPLWEHHICSAQYHSSPPLSVCLLYSSPVSRANVIEFNIMDVHIFSHIFRCIVKSMLRIPKLVIVRPGWWMLHWMWRIAGWGWCEVRWGDTQCGSWCYMTSPQSSHHSNQVFQTLKLTFNNLEGNWLWGGSQVWDHDITDIVVQRSPRIQSSPSPTIPQQMSWKVSVLISDLALKTHSLHHAHTLLALYVCKVCIRYDCSISRLAQFLLCWCYDVWVSVYNQSNHILTQLGSVLSKQADHISHFADFRLHIHSLPITSYFTSHFCSETNKNPSPLSPWHLRLAGRVRAES